MDVGIIFEATRLFTKFSHSEKHIPRVSTFLFQKRTQKHTVHTPACRLKSCQTA